MTNRFSHQALTGALSAALLAGCSAGSQFAPPPGSAGSQPAAFQQAAVAAAAPMHAPKSGRSAGVSPAWVMYTGCVMINGHCVYYYINIWGVWEWIPTSIKRNSGGSTLGGSLAKAGEFDMATTGGTISIYSGKTLVTTLEGLKAAASGVATDSRGNTFAAVNVAGAATLDEFAAGSDTPTATYSDQNLKSVESLGIDKANNVYVEGQSQNGTIEVDEMIGSGGFESLAQSGTLGSTSGGLAVQTSGKTTYLWINDLGNASDPTNIARYELTGKSLVKQSSFDYAGVNGAIAVDPTGKDTSHVYAVNNVAVTNGQAAPEYSVSGIEYAYPSGQIVSQSPAQTANQESLGIWVK
jgi:hypothetical protein